MVRSLPPLALILVFALHAAAGAQEADFAQRFRVFTRTGEPATLEDVVRAMAAVDAVLVGETHTDPVGHWVEAELWRRAVEQFGGGEGAGTRPLALSLEMFETDVQGIVDEYLKGLITEEQLKASARPWEHYATDYRPMVELARERGLTVIAANAPRRYVNRVSRLGREALDDLPAWSLSFLPPLPYPQPSAAYRAEWTALMTEMPMEDQCPAPAPDSAGARGRARAPAAGVAAAGDTAAVRQPTGRTMPRAAPDSAGGAHASARMPTHMANFMENGIQAQTLWDASMALSLTNYLGDNPGGLVLHMVGGFHVENFTGIPEKVQDYRPGTRSLVVSLEPADDFATFDPAKHAGQGNFVILTDRSLDLYVARNCGGG